MRDIYIFIFEGVRVYLLFYDGGSEGYFLNYS